MDWKAVALFLSLVALALAAPIKDGSVCASECSPAFNQKFKYLTKKAYHYTYESKISIRHEGVSNETAALKHTFGVEFHVQAPCEILLKINNAKLADVKPDPKVPPFKKSLEEKVLLFAYHDGRITEVCPDPKDSAWVVNLKKAVLSSFQNTMDNHLDTTVREVDVSGQCDTHYTIKEAVGQKVTVVTKIKDIASCTDRLGNNSRIQADSYVSFSHVQSLPVTKSSHECKQTIKDGILTESICEETHLLELYNKGDKGTTARTYTKLAYVKTTNSAIKSPKKVSSKVDLLYDHTDEYKYASDVQGATNVLREICQNTKDDVSPAVPALFTKLVYKIRHLSAAEINGLLKKSEGKDICETTKAKDALLSSLAMAGSDGAVQVIAQILATGNVTPLREKLWYTSFAILRDPSAAVIEATIPLIDVPKPKRIALLGVSSLAHTYCRHHPDCENDKPIQKLIDKLAKHLGDDCKVSNDDDEDRVVATLKAFGNLGHAGDHENTLTNCMDNTLLRHSVRIAAIKAFHRFPCESHIHRELTYKVTSTNEDAEIRIESFLAYARCLNDHDVSQIEYLLEHEDTNQVSNFIWSYIRNLKRTESPEKTKLKKLANKIHLERKFGKNPSKYSYNFEWSRFSENNNVGATVESNVIFSTSSYLPRSINTGLQVEIVGRKIDLFEVDLDLRGFEQPLERLFGPTKNPRPKRETFPLVTGSSKNAPITAPDPEQKPEASLSFKVFGNEIRWYNFHNYYDLRDERSHKFEDILEKMAKHKEVDILRNALFVDTYIAIPTATGISLKLQLNGTASFGLKLVSHFDIRQIFKTPRSADIDTFIKPSLAAELSSSFYIDAGSYSSGVKKVSHFHSSTELRAKVDLKESNSLAVDVDLPKEEQEIFHSKVDLYLITGESQRPLKLINNDQYNFNACTKPSLGLQICGTSKFPKPLFDESRPWIFASGPQESQLTIKKFDPKMQGYQLRATWKRDKDSSGNIAKSHILFSYDTPGTAVSHKHSIEFLLDRPGKQLKAELITPITSAKLNGQISVAGNTKKVQLSLTVDGKEDIDLQGEILVETKGNKITYKPTLKSKNGVISGLVTRDVGRKITFDVQLKENPDRFKIKGYLARDEDRSLLSPGESSADLEVNLPSLKAHFIGKRLLAITEQGLTHTLDITIDHHLKALGWEKHTSTYKRNFQRTLQPDGKVNGNYFAEFTSTRIPKYNYRVKVDYAAGEEQLAYTLDAHYGPNLDDNIHKLFISESISIKRSDPGKFDLQMSGKYVHPPSEINWETATKTHYEEGELNHDTKILSNGANKLNVNLNYKKQPGKYGNDYKASLAASYPGREVVFSHEREHYAQGKSKGKTHLQWEAGKFVDIVGKYAVARTEQETDIEADIQVTLYNNPVPIRKYGLIIHKEPRKLNFKAEVVRPDDTYFAQLNYDVSADYANINGVANIKLQTITGKLELKKQPTQTTGTLDYKSPRRHIIGSYKSKGPYENRQVDAELKWDAENDASQKIIVQATVKRPKGKRAAEIKGSITGPTKSLKGTVTYDLPEQLFDGKHVVTADVEYAPRKKVTFNAEVFIDKSDLGKRTSRGKISYNSPSYPDFKLNYNTSFEYDGIYSRLRVQGQVDGANLKTETFNIYHKRGDESIRTSIEGIHDGEEYGFAVSFRVPRFTAEHVAFGAGLGVALPKTGTNRAFVIDYNRRYTPDHVLFDYHSYVRLAQDKEFGFDAEYYRDVERGANNAVKSIEFRGKLKTILPNEAYRKQYLAAHAKLDFPGPDTPAGALNAEVNAQWADGKKGTVKIDMATVGKTDGTLKVVVLTPSSPKPVLEINRQLKTIVKGDEATFKLDTSVTWYRDGYPKTLTWNTDVTINVPYKGNFKAEIKIKTPFEKVPTAKVTVEVKRTADSLSAKAQVEWGSGKTLQLDGKVTLAKDGQSFDANFAFDSKALGANDWKLDISRKIVSSIHRKYALNFKIPTAQYALDLSATDKPNGKKIDGALEINQRPFLSYNIDSTEQVNGDNRERKTVIKFDSAAIVLSVETQRIWGPRKALVSFQACPSEEKCFKLEYLRDNRIDPSSKFGYEYVDFEWHVLASAKGLDGDDYSRTAGIFVRRKTDEKRTSNSARITTWDEKQKYIGYTYEKTITSYRNFNRDLQIKLPSRVVQYTSVVKSGEYLAQIDADLLLDAKREPSRKLSFTFLETFNRETHTANRKVALKHPDLPKEITLTSVSTVKRDGGITSHSELSLFQDPSKTITYDFDVKVTPYYSYSNFSIVYTVRQLNWLNIDSRFTANIAFAKEGYDALLEYNWKSGNKGYKIIQFETGADRITKQLILKLWTPWRKLVLDGHWHALDSNPRGIGGVRADFALSKDDKVVRKASFDGSLQPQINLKYYADPQDANRLFRLHGGLEDPTTFHLEATRLRDGKEYNDAELVAHLNSSRLLFVKLDWKPELPEDIHNGLDSRLEYLTTKAGEMGEHLSTEFGELYKNRKAAFQAAIAKDWGPAIQKSQERFARLRNELKEDLAKRDDEGVHLIVNGLVGDFAETNEALAALDEIRDKIRAFLQARVQRIGEFLKNLPEYITELNDRLKERLAALPERILGLIYRLHDRLHSIGAGIIRFIEAVEDGIESIKKGEGLLGFVYTKLNELSERISQRISEYKEKYAGKSLWERLKERLENYAVNHPESKEFIEGFISAVESFRQNIRDIIEGVRTKLGNFRKHFFETYTDAYEKASTNPQVQELVAEFRNLRLKLQEKYQAYSEERGLYAYWQQKLAEYRERIAYYLGKHDVYDFENGHVVAYVPLFFPINNLRHIRKAFSVRSHWEKEETAYLTKYFLKRLFNKQDPLPPIDGHALLIGDNHYVTFDGKSFEFEDRCSYLLTKDFVDGNFSVVVNYEDIKGEQVKKSITIYADGHAIDLLKDQRIFVDKNEDSRSQHLGNIHIDKSPEQTVVSVKGLQVVYDYKNSFVLFELNGFYYGKVAGLLGKYNYEANDDFTGPSGSTFYNTEEFAHSWQTNSQCSHGHHHDSHQKASYGSAIYDLCHASLDHDDHDSDLHECFPIVNPDPYLDICLHIDEHSGNTKEDACHKIAAYVELCHHLYVDVAVPEECSSHSH